MPISVYKRGISDIAIDNEVPLLADNCSSMLPGYIFDTGINYSAGKLVCADSSASRSIYWGDPDISQLRAEATIKANAYAGSAGWQSIWLKHDAGGLGNFVACFVDKNLKKIYACSKNK